MKKIRLSQVLYWPLIPVLFFLAYLLACFPQVNPLSSVSILVLIMGVLYVSSLLNHDSVQSRLISTLALLCLSFALARTIQSQFSVVFSGNLEQNASLCEGRGASVGLGSGTDAQVFAAVRASFAQTTQAPQAIHEQRALPGNSKPEVDQNQKLLRCEYPLKREPRSHFMARRAWFMYQDHSTPRWKGLLAWRGLKNEAATLNAGVQRAQLEDTQAHPQSFHLLLIHGLTSRGERRVFEDALARVFLADEKTDSTWKRELGFFVRKWLLGDHYRFRDAPIYVDFLDGPCNQAGIGVPSVAKYIEFESYFNRRCTLAGSACHADRLPRLRSIRCLEFAPAEHAARVLFEMPVILAVQSNDLFVNQKLITRAFVDGFELRMGGNKEIHEIVKTAEQVQFEIQRLSAKKDLSLLDFETFSSWDPYFSPGSGSEEWRAFLPNQQLAKRFSDWFQLAFNNQWRVTW